MLRSLLGGLAASAVITLCVACGATARGGAGPTTGLSVANLRSTFRAKGLPLEPPTWHHFGPISRVQYLDFGRGGRITPTAGSGVSIRAGFFFTVLVFRSATEARSALAASLNYLKRVHTPVIRRDNVVLAARVPIDEADQAAVWRRAQAALRAS